MTPIRCVGGFFLMVSSALVWAEDQATTDTFRKLLAAEWEYTLREAPTFASHLGDKRYNDRWPDVSLAAIDRRHGHQQDVLAQLDKIDPQQLSPADRLNYQLYRKELELCQVKSERLTGIKRHGLEWRRSNYSEVHHVSGAHGRYGPERCRTWTPSGNGNSWMRMSRSKPCRSLSNCSRRRIFGTSMYQRTQSSRHSRTYQPEIW